MPEIAVEDAPASMPLPDKLDYAACTDFAENLSAQSETDICLDASQVSFLSARAIELMLVAQANGAAKGHGFSVSAPSEAFLSGVAALGLQASTLNCEGQA